MFSESKIRKIVLLLLLFWYSVELAQAGEQIVLSPQDGHSNQNQINRALEEGDVYLGPGVYEVDNTIIMRSNRVLAGDPNAIIKVWGGSSQWFKGKTGVISCQEAIHDVEIYGFQIDGNIRELPKRYADSRSDTSHDCEKLIVLWGNSNNFAKNIRIHDMKLYNAFSDGIYIIYADGVACYDNIMSNCQHEGIYFSVVKNGHIHNNKIAGITSDCARLDNCDTCLVEYNLFFSYGGESYGAYKHGENGLQIGDAGSSKGYNAAKKGYPTRNIEVRFNTFADPGLRAIWLHGGENVYIHDNEFIDATELETMGVPIGDISVDNPPSLELTEKVFSSIFDILDVEFSDTGRTGQTSDSFSYRNFKKYETTQGIVAGYIKIIGFKDVVVIDDVPYIPNKDAILTKSRAVRSPDLMGWAGHIKKIDKKETVEIKDGIAYASLKVETSWYTIKTNTLTGEKKKSKTKTSNTVFEDSAPAYDILKRDTEAIVYAHVFKDTKNPVTRINIPVSDSIQKIEITYGENSSTRLLMLGERAETDEGLIYTTLSRCDIRTGSIPFMGDEYVIYGDFNPSKLHVEYFTPYESFPAKVEIVEHKKEERGIIVSMFSFLAQLIMALYAGYKIMDIAFN